MLAAADPFDPPTHTTNNSTNKLGLALLSPAIEVEVTQQRVQYGIGVLHNRLLRRGLDASLESSPTLGGAQSSCAKGEGVEGVKGRVEEEEEEEEEEQEEDEFDREPAQLVFVVHGIGEKMWASEMIQVGSIWICVCVCVD